MSRQHVYRICVNIFLAFILLLTHGCGGNVPAITANNDHDNSPTYSVGGTIKGLIGTGLVLQDNGVDKLVIKENGTFNFPTQLTDGNQCNVTILSQPTDPQQGCQVTNGNQKIDGSNISNIEVDCVSGILEEFNGKINANYWESNAEYRRELSDGALQYVLTTKSNLTLNYLYFKDKSCGSVSMDTTITDTLIEGKGNAEYATRLESCGYHSTTPGERKGRKTGDVFAAIELKGSHAPFQAYYYVFKCIVDDCKDRSSIELLSSGAAGSNLLGQVALNEPARLLIDWDRLSPGQFSFQLNHNPIVTFDPAAAGAPIDAMEANAPGKYFGVRTLLSNPNDTADMTATFDNVMVNERRYDNFENMTYPDGSLWGQTYGTVGINNGRLIMETAKEYTGDLSADNGDHTTSLYSSTNLVPNQDIASADISMNSGSTINDNGGSPVEGDAVLEMTFRPPGVNEKDWTNAFLVQAGLREDASGVRAVVRVIGCADSSCQARYTDETQPFNAVVANNSFYHFSIEKTDNNNINISLDNSENISLDLSIFNEFATNQFKNVGLKTISRGTDAAGDEAFIRAVFDNIQVGNPN
jgi:hypothetical protein